jgi:hypothetical protein
MKTEEMKKRIEKYCLLLDKYLDRDSHTLSSLNFIHIEHNGRRYLYSNLNKCLIESRNLNSLELTDELTKKVYEAMEKYIHWFIRSNSAEWASSKKKLRKLIGGRK